MLLELCQQLTEEESAAKAVRLTSIAQVVWCVKMAEQTVAAGADAGDVRGNVLGMAAGVAAAAEKQDDLLQRLGRCLTELEQLAASAATTPVVTEAQEEQAARHHVTADAANEVGGAEAEVAEAQGPAEPDSVMAEAAVVFQESVLFEESVAYVAATMDDVLDLVEEEEASSYPDEKEQEQVAMAVSTEDQGALEEVIVSDSESESEDEVVDLLAGGGSSGGLWGPHSQAADDASFERETMARTQAKADAFAEETRQARAWISAVRGKPLPAGDIGEVLRDGTVLCEVSCKFNPVPLPWALRLCLAAAAREIGLWIVLLQPLRQQFRSSPKHRCLICFVFPACVRLSTC